jgi:hypothetical protein
LSRISAPSNQVSCRQGTESKLNINAISKLR